MLVSSIIHARPPFRKLAVLAALTVSSVFVTSAALAKDNGTARIPLDPIGFQLPQQQFLLAGSTMMTLDFVDNNHLLLTYGTKKLLKRLPECPPSDEDRFVEAVIVELPSGKPLARTTWRLHDRGQYLWSLGHGRFLLRSRDSLSTIAPMVNHAQNDAFRERPLIETKRRIGGILISPDADLLILETLEPRKPSGLEEAIGASPARTTAEEEQLRAEKPVQINFFTMIHGAGDVVELKAGLATRSRVPGRIPANSAGLITVVSQGQQRWAFDFDTYDGKKIELSPFDSTCRPSPILVSRGEFIAFGCQLSHTPQVIGGFNMRGEEMWQQNMTETYMAPSFSYAPTAGRFAFSRMLTHTSLVTDDIIAPEMVAGQNIIVYQTDTGRQLLRIDAAPVARAGQNFSLSPDGLSLAVIRNGAIEIFPLPPLSGKDREAVQRAQASAPQLTGAPNGSFSPAIGDVTPPPASTSPRPNVPIYSSQPRNAQPVAPTATPAPVTPITSTQPSNQSAKPEPAAAPAQKNPDGQEEAPRRPPTLYNEPGERPQANSEQPR